MPVAHSCTVDPVSCRPCCVFSVKVELGGWYVMQTALWRPVTSLLEATFAIVTLPGPLLEEL